MDKGGKRKRPRFWGGVRTKALLRIEKPYKSLEIVQ